MESKWSLIIPLCFVSTFSCYGNSGDGVLSPIILLLGIIKITDTQFNNCVYEQVLEVGKIYYIYSPNYPYENYHAGATCRWIAKSHRLINMTCSDFHLPESPQCNLDAVIIQHSNLSADRYCGNRSFSIISEDNQITTELHSSPFSNGGSFFCTLETVTTITDEMCQCGWKNPTRIVGGVNTGVNEYPMMAGLVDVINRLIFCGATIINNEQVLTAAHCLYGKDMNLIGVVVGEHDVSKGSETNITRLFRVESINIHSKYSTKTGDYDIAIVNVHGKIIFNQLVGPVCLPFQHSQDSFAESYVEILGWGSVGYGEGKSDVLQKAQVSVITNRECRGTYPSITQKQLCTLEAGKDTCQFDSGGPVLWSNPATKRIVTVSIVSYGSICADGTPAVNSRVGSYIDWILQYTPLDFIYCKLE